jgi:Fe-S-cluster-containing dehydrogenase component
MSRKAFVVDVAKCNGCGDCQVACREGHAQFDERRRHTAPPDPAQPWLKLVEHVQGSSPKMRKHYLPVICMHCDDARCIASCPVEKAIYKRDDGLVIIDAANCTGCKACVAACPYGRICFNGDLNVAQKCTGCADLLDLGVEEPRCVAACPTRALGFAEEAYLNDTLVEASVLQAYAKAQPRVFYLNRPKRFITGKVSDSITKDPVDGAMSVLVNVNSGSRTCTRTDFSGDFWLENLGEARFILTIEKDGYAKKVVASIETLDEVDLGGIRLDPILTLDNRVLY